MELTDLRIFRTVVETGGITRAAARLHRVQSNVTTRIRQLEADLGVPLFVREGRRLQLAPAGRTLVGYADRLLALADEAREAVASDMPRGTLRLGAMESTAAARLPEPLAAFHARHPAVAVELRTGNPSQLVAQVLAGELDAALVAEPVVDDRLATRAAFVEELVLVSAAAHSRIASPRDVGNGTLLAFEPGCPHRKRLEDWYGRDGAVPSRLVEVGSYHALLGCVAAGMGVALMPRSVLASFTAQAQLSVHPLKAPLRHATTLLVWRREGPSANVAAFAEVMLSSAARKPSRPHAHSQ